MKSKEDRIKWFESALERNSRKLQNNRAQIDKINVKIIKAEKRKKWLELNLEKLKQ